MNDTAAALRETAQSTRETELAQNRWAHFTNMMLGAWLVTQPPLIGLQNPWLGWTEVLLGLALIVFSALSLSIRFVWARWAAAATGALIAAVPFLFWSRVGADYLSDTLIGMLAIGLAIATKPDPGPRAAARIEGPVVPPGWSYNPSSWTQRAPIILLAIIGLTVSRYLAAYQLGYIDHVWEPFFAGDAANPRNGTEEIITSFVSHAWPVSDAAVGGYTYALEIVTGFIGSRARWRTMPWLVFLFGLMIVPLGFVSLLFVIIQPIVIGTWSTLTLVSSAAVLIQIPYSLDELLAVLEFLRRRVRAGKSLVRVFFFGDTDEGGESPPANALDKPPLTVVKEMVTGGVTLPWNLAAAAAIGIFLPFSRLTLGATGLIADADHLLGWMVLAVVSLSAAELARPARFLLVPLGLLLAGLPFLAGISGIPLAVRIVLGAALILLSLRRGPILQRYGKWDRWLV